MSFNYKDKSCEAVLIFHFSIIASHLTLTVYFPQNVVDRVTSLPLVSSTYGLVYSVYSTTKDHHPYIKSVCEAAEQGVRTITAVALTTASPIMGKLEPQSKNPWFNLCVNDEVK